MNFCLKYPVIDCRFYNILPFPQSELYNDLIAQGLDEVTIDNNVFGKDGRVYSRYNNDYDT